MKTRMYYLTLIMVCSFALTAFSQNKTAMMVKLEKINKEMADAMLTGNTEKTLSFYAKDAISMPNNEKMLEGIDAIRKSNEEMKKAGWKCVAFEPKTLKVSINNNLITEIGSYKISFTGPGLEKPFSDAGKYLTIWEKQSDGSLKTKYEIWNSDGKPMDAK